jgi:hypothetical protein
VLVNVTLAPVLEVVGAEHTILWLLEGGFRQEEGEVEA